MEKLIEEKGRTPVAYLADLGVLSDRTIAAHCVHVSPEDIDILVDFEVGVAHNPVSNLKLASGVSPVPAMAEAGVKLGIGTDGAASNNTLDLLRDMQIAALLHKGVSGDPTVLPARSMVEMATIGGARVLGLDAEIGSLAEGKQADLVCLGLDGPHAIPAFDPWSHLVFAARASDVRHVLVGGQLVVGNRKLNTLDSERIEAQAWDFAQQLKK